ncbi:AAA family ATPase [Candidatus Micrarchaeota archaeon]|nr:AAA family ATPase [Candidatus Micrarchaeota archaeon]
MEHQSVVMIASKNRIIQDESVLLPRFYPKSNLGCRQAVGESVLAAMNSLQTGHLSENVFISGPSGSGKTALVRWAIGEVEESRRLLCIYANCCRYNTSMSIFTKIADALGEPVSRRGRASDEIFDRIVELMRYSKKPVLLVLDEIEALIHYDDARILQNIAHLDEEKVYFGIIGISDNEAVLSKLPQETREILRFTKIEIPQFTRDELLTLLKERASAGLRPGSYDSSLIEEIADISVASHGGGRFALEILWRAARSSEDQGLAEVSKNDVLAIKREIGLIGAELSREELLIHGLLKEGQKTTTELYPLFRSGILRTKRQIRNYLRAMDQKGLISIENVMAGNRPRCSIIRLRGD